MLSQSLILIKRPLSAFVVRVARKLTNLYAVFDVKYDEAPVEWRFRLAERIRDLVDGFLVVLTILGLFFVAWWLCWFAGRAFSNP